MENKNIEGKTKVGTKLNKEPYAKFKAKANEKSIRLKKAIPNITFEKWHKEHYPFDSKFPNKFAKEIGERKEAFEAGQDSLGIFGKADLIININSNNFKKLPKKKWEIYLKEKHKSEIRQIFGELIHYINKEQAWATIHRDSRLTQHALNMIRLDIVAMSKKYEVE